MSATAEAKPDVDNKRDTNKAIIGRISGVAFVLAVGLIVAATLIQLQGYDPLATIQAGLTYALGDGTSIARTFTWGLPLFVAALGVAVAFGSGMFNIGAEGQVYTGAMAGALVGAYLGPMPSFMHIGLGLAAAALAGALVAGALGWLRAAWGVDEVLSTLLSNYIIILFCTYLATGPLKDPGRQSGTTKEVYDTAMFGELLPRTGLTTAVFVVAAIAITVWWISDKSVLGYRWRMTGESPHFAAAVGMNVTKSRVGSMAASGALCAIGGALLVFASQGRFWTEIGGGLGWDAVLIALIGRARPIPTVVWAGLYCVMRSMARGIEQASSVPSELSLILVAAVIIAASAQAGVFQRFAALRNRFRRTSQEA